MLIMVLYTIVILVIIQLVAARTEQRRRTCQANALLDRAEKDLDLPAGSDVVKRQKINHEREAMKAW